MITLPDIMVNIQQNKFLVKNYVDTCDFYLLDNRKYGLILLQQAEETSINQLKNCPLISQTSLQTLRFSNLYIQANILPYLQIQNFELAPSGIYFQRVSRLYHPLQEHPKRNNPYC